VRTAYTDEGRRKHALARDEEAKGGLSMVNTNEGEPKHAHEKAKGCVNMVNMDEGR